MPASHQPEQNRLLRVLSEEQRQRVYPHLELVPLPPGRVLHECGEVIRHAWFPVDAIVSLVYVMEDGSSAEISVIGHEGVVGTAAFMGGETSSSRAVVQSGGHAFRLPVRHLLEEFHRHGTMHDVLLRYTHTLLTQAAQTAACNRHHTVDQQLCRLLLLSDDRLPSSHIVMTQERIASMLGVRREGVTEAAGKLQKRGVIKYRRGHITILDRPALERLCCECYSVVRLECDRLIGDEARTPARPSMPLPMPRAPEPRPSSDWARGA